MSILELAGVASTTEEGSVYDLLFHYFQLNQTPTDEQIRALAISLGRDPESFERLVFKMLAAIVEEVGEDVIHSEFDDEDSELEDELLGIDSEFDDDFLEEAAENNEVNEDEEKKGLYYDGTPDNGQDAFDEIVQHDGEVETKRESPNERPLAADDGTTI